MAIKQLSVYAENNKGSLANILQVLADAGINLLTMSIADTNRYGIIRLVADDTQKALDVLKTAGLTANVRDVVAVAIPNESGGLAKVLRILSDNDINLEYAYSIVVQETGVAYVAMRVDDNDKTETMLKDNGITVLNQGDI